MIRIPRLSARVESPSATREAICRRSVEIDRRGEGTVEGAVTRPQAPAGKNEMVAEQAQRAGVEVKHLALLVEQRRGGADQLEPIGDPASPRAGEQRRQRRGDAANRARRAGGRTIVEESIGGRLHGGLVARRFPRPDGDGHASLRSETERDFSAD